MRCLLSLLALFVGPALSKADDVSIAVGKEAIEFKAGSGVVAKYAIAETVAATSVQSDELLSAFLELERVTIGQ